MATVVVSEQSVRATADAMSFARGQAYFREGRVRQVEVGGTGVTAVVDGGSAYRVRLVVTVAGIGGRCSCPYGAEGVFCKHCVAAALAWLDGHGEPGEPWQQSGSDDSGDGLRQFLLAQDVDWLVDELLRVAESDLSLRARLDIAAAAGSHDGYDERSMRARLRSAIEIADYVDYGDAFSYFQDVSAALDDLADLVDQDLADAAMTLAEYALELLDEVGQLVDGSSGGLGEALAQAQEIHFEACSAGSPDQVRLAEYLVRRALGSDYETFLDAVPAYESVLGDVGMARYRELVKAAWRELPPKRPGEYGTGRFAVTHLMERLAEYEGGTDALIDVLARDVSSGYDVLRIAQRLCDDKRDDEALEWIARGLKEFPPEARLRSLAAECHLRAGRRAEAVELVWANFSDRATLDTYIALHHTAAETFPAWRDRALAVFRKNVSQSTWHQSTMVEVLLWEGETDAAWQAAVEGGCRPELWLRVARQRAATHPADAIPVLLRAADQWIAHKNRGAYQEAAKLLVEAKALSVRSDRYKDFENHLLALRTAHKPKRALLEELDRARLP